MQNNINDSVTAERVRILYSNIGAQNLVTIVASVMLIYIFRNQISEILLLIWCFLMLLGISLRALCQYNYKKQIIDSHDNEKHELYFIYASAVVGIGWALLIALSLNQTTLVYRIYGVLILAALVGMAIPTLMSSIKTLYVYTIPSIIVTISLLIPLGGNYSALGMAVLVCSVVIIRSGKNLHKVLIKSLVEQATNKKLLLDLEQTRNEKSVAEQRMQDILDYAPAAIYVKDLDGHFTFLNQKVADLHKLERKEIIGKTLHDILPSDIADQIRKNDIDVINARQPLKYEESAPQDDGLHHYLSIKFPLFDETGQLYATSGVSTDITERVRAEESLRISQQRLLLHREQSPVGVIEWNTDFVFLDWNPAAEKLFGYSKEEVTGRHITERILPESARAAVNVVWQELLENRGGTYSLNENTTKDGSTILCEWYNTPLVDANGKVIGVTSLVDDVTDRQKNEDMLRQTQKMDAIGKLTGGIAHDFNNMLGVILGFSQLLKARVSADDVKQNKYCDEILNAGERAKKLTSKLLEFSRTAPSSAETVYINKLLHGMQHMLEKTLTPRIKLALELEENLWPVRLDDARLEDTILNVCINSMHAMPDGGTLTISTRNMQFADLDIKNSDITPGDYVLLSLSDTGIGMSREIQQKIFDPFFTTKDDGTGLGMSQVYGFVQQSGGNITVYSEPGHGTQLVLYIPRDKEPEVDKSEQKASDSELLPSGDETILLVDDEISLLDLTEEILSSYGYTIYRAENALEALELLKRKPVDLLLSDVVMPGMDGYQLASEVRKLYPSIKIQMASGYTDERNRNLTDGTLHQQRLHKPFSAEELLNRLRSLLDE